LTYLHCNHCGTILSASAHPPVTICPRCFAEGEYPVPELAEGIPPDGAHPDIDVVRRVFRLMQLGERERMLELFDERFEGRPLSTEVTISGRGQARAYLDEATAGQSSLEPAVFRFERNGRGQVGVFGRLRVRRPEGIVDTPAAWIYWVEEGKIVRAESYTSMAAAQRTLHAAGAGPECERPAEAGLSQSMDRSQESGSKQLR
jgi:ketosteroid isomerase-like protein